MPTGVYNRRPGLKRFHIKRRSDMKQREIRECLGGCGLKKEVQVTSKWERCRICYEKTMVGGTTGHKTDCTCSPCRAKRSELTGVDNPMFGKATSELQKVVARRINLGKVRSKESTQKGVTTRNKKYGSYYSNVNEHTRNVLKATCKRPNKFETNALNYVNAIYGNKFTYTGDGSFIRNGKSADAVAEDIKTIALFHGIYFHWGKTHPKVKITESDRRSIEKIDSIPFLASGYKVIFVWEDELNKVLNKVGAL